MVVLTSLLCLVHHHSYKVFSWLLIWYAFGCYIGYILTLSTKDVVLATKIKGRSNKTMLITECTTNHIKNNLHVIYTTNNIDHQIIILHHISLQEYIYIYIILIATFVFVQHVFFERKFNSLIYINTILFYIPNLCMYIISVFVSSYGIPLA